MRRVWLCLPILLLFLSACARQTLVLSEPAGASLLIDGRVVGQTPCRFEYRLGAGQAYELELAKEGYLPLRHQLRSRETDHGVRNRWLAAGLVWSPLWLGTFFTKKLQDRYLFILEQAPAGRTLAHQTLAAPH